VLREACRRGAQWAAEGRPLTVSVNLAAGQLVTADLPDVVTACLAESGLPPSLLCLEITETVLLDDLDELAVQLKALRDLGVGVHIDDFGTGYCSLTYLRQLPVTGIKIDRTFVRGLCSTVEDRAIVSSTINLGRTMGLDVVAEGVEDAVTLAALKELGCTHGQGYLWSRPVDPSELVFAPNLGDSRGLVDGIH
jgi:EAL domain-containing protein (putative c-di-GMP-specific phosphodiesterase class I)